MSRNRQTLRTLLLTSLAAAWLTAANGWAEEPTRTWTSADRTQKLQARLVTYDQTTGWLQLKLADGTTRSISDRKISSADRRYLRGFLKRQSAEEKATVSQEEPKANQRPSRQKNSTGSRYGIDWANSVSDAFQQAAATDSNKDDRPVFCFRVLGNLSGPM